MQEFMRRTNCRLYFRTMQTAEKTKYMEVYTNTQTDTKPP